jgi:hypothetical protein
VSDFLVAVCREPLFLQDARKRRLCNSDTFEVEGGRWDTLGATCQELKSRAKNSLESFPRQRCSKKNRFYLDRTFHDTDQKSASRRSLLISPRPVLGTNLPRCLRNSAVSIPAIRFVVGAVISKSITGQSPTRGKSYARHWQEVTRDYQPNWRIRSRMSTL